jgi:hypothetical protein
LFEGHGGDVKQPLELALEDHLAELLEQKRALDDQRNARCSQRFSLRENNCVPSDTSIDISKNPRLRPMSANAFDWRRFSA